MTEHILTHYGRKYNKKEKEWIKTRSEHQDIIKADNCDCLLQYPFHNSKWQQLGELTSAQRWAYPHCQKLI